MDEICAADFFWKQLNIHEWDEGMQYFGDQKSRNIILLRSLTFLRLAGRLFALRGELKQICFAKVSKSKYFLQN